MDKMLEQINQYLKTQQEDPTIDLETKKALELLDTLKALGKKLEEVSKPGQENKSNSKSLP